MIAGLSVALCWAHIALHALLGLDWLGTRPLLQAPTFVAGFGHLRLWLEHYTGTFALMLVPGTFLGVLVVAGTAQILSRAWGGQGTRAGGS